ncbi:MAG: NifU family protein [Planctomycetota bacterium]|nr:NifU family protein [Planctomycetota bacterium]
MVSRKEIDMPTLQEKVAIALNKIRPMLEADGGGIELVNVNEQNAEVKVKLTGACGCCPMSQMTLKTGVEKVLRKEIPEIKTVTAV